MRMLTTYQSRETGLQGGRARPVVGTIVELGPTLADAPLSDPNLTAPGAHNIPSDLIPIRSLSAQALLVE